MALHPGVQARGQACEKVGHGVMVNDKAGQHRAHR
jgi:hypothetical protein